MVVPEQTLQAARDSKGEKETGGGGGQKTVGINKSMKERERERVDGERGMEKNTDQLVVPSLNRS